jgi:glutaredoxin
MSKITIISAPYCSYCLELKERLDKLDLKFNDVDITLEENKVECERLSNLSFNSKQYEQ